PLEHAAAGELGATVLAELDGEAWVALDRREEDPRPVAAIFILDRAGAEGAAVEVLERAPLPLLAHALRSRAWPERMRSRFELFGDLAARVPQYRLRTGGADPAELADLVERTLEGDPSEVRHDES
ncbi:MAG: hypothetical protein ACRDKX_08230, partial [Solirubrobacterales bacterium]